MVYLWFSKIRVAVIGLLVLYTHFILFAYCWLLTYPTTLHLIVFSFTNIILEEQPLNKLTIMNLSFLITILRKNMIGILIQLNDYMSLDNHPTFGNRLKEVVSDQPTVIMQVKKFERFEQKSISAHLWGSFRLYLVFEFCLKSKSKWYYIGIASAMSIKMNENIE